jgi:hypothetical protein
MNGRSPDTMKMGSNPARVWNPGRVIFKGDIIMKNVQHLRWLIVAVILIVGISVCNRAQSSNSPTADQFTNFYAGRGNSDEYGVYIGNEVFVVQVPDGDYVLRYETDLGTFDLVFRATEKSLLYVGLTAGDTLINMTVFPGTIFDTSKESQTYGAVTLFVWPGSSTTWQDVFRQP